MRSPPRPPSRGQAIAAMAVLLVCASGLTYAFWPIHGVLFQIYALVVLFLTFRYCPPLLAWFRQMPTAHRVIFFLLIGSVVIGHFTLTTRRYFPFVAWDIFATVSEKSPVECRELIGTTADGKSVRLLVEQIFPSITQFDLPPTDQPELMEHLVQAMAKIYNQHHASAPVRHVDLMLLAVPLHPLSDEGRNEQPSCELLQRYDISSARSN